MTKNTQNKLKTTLLHNFRFR